jgi:16S rRNA (guanine527-N7)-methyltransferase
MSAAAPLEAAGVPPVVDAESFAQASGATVLQVGDLERYRSLLTEWNQRMNLVGSSTLEAFWSRHAWDSAQLLGLTPEARTWADLGAGAGLPGVVLAVLGKGTAGFHVHLVESVGKRCRFLEDVVRNLDLPATVHHARAESLKLKVEVVTARAVAPLSRLFGYAAPHLRGGALGLFPKGQDVASEIEEATRYWKFEADVVPSLSDPRGRIVRVRRFGGAR